MTTSTISAVAGANATRSEIGVARIPPGTSQTIVVVATTSSDEIIAAVNTINKEYQKFFSSRTLLHSSLEDCQKALTKIQDYASAILGRGEEGDEKKFTEMKKKVQEMIKFEADLLAEQNIISFFQEIDRSFEDFTKTKKLNLDSLEKSKTALKELEHCDIELGKTTIAGYPIVEFQRLLDASRQKVKQMTEANSSLVSCSMKIIDDAYREFCQAQGAAPSTTTTAVQVFNPTAFDRCVSALGEIEASYRQAAQEGRSTEQLKSDFEQAQRQVQEMNMASGVLTRQDVRGIQSFTQPPIETYYIDRSGTKYIQPDHSQLLAFGGKFFLQGEYEGIGLTRQQIFGGKVCDILYMTKKPDQIEFEIRRTSKPRKEKSSSKQESPQDEQNLERLLIQGKLLKAVEAELEAKVRQQWKYGSYEICDYQRLREKGLSEEYARKSHAIAFYYKKVGGEQK